MQAIAGSVESGKLNFGKEFVMFHRRLKRPLAQKILFRFPKIASALAAVGAKRAVVGDSGETGKLATMMTASGSIDYVGKDKKSFQFYLRPMS